MVILMHFYHEKEYIKLRKFHHPQILRKDFIFEKLQIYNK